MSTTSRIVAIAIVGLAMGPAIDALAADTPTRVPRLTRPAKRFELDVPRLQRDLNRDLHQGTAAQKAQKVTAKLGVLTPRLRTKQQFIDLALTVMSEVSRTSLSPRWIGPVPNERLHLKVFAKDAGAILRQLTSASKKYRFSKDELTTLRDAAHRYLGAFSTDSIDLKAYDADGRRMREGLNPMRAHNSALWWGESLTSFKNRPEPPLWQAPL